MGVLLILVRMALGQYVVCVDLLRFSPVGSICSNGPYSVTLPHQIVFRAYQTTRCPTKQDHILIIRHFQGFIAEATFPLLVTSQCRMSCGSARCLPFAECTCTSENWKKKVVHRPVFPSRNCGSWSSGAAGPDCYIYSVSWKLCS